MFDARIGYFSAKVGNRALLISSAFRLNSFSLTT